MGSNGWQGRAETICKEHVKWKRGRKSKLTQAAQNFKTAKGEEPAKQTTEQVPKAKRKAESLKSHESQKIICQYI